MILLSAPPQVLPSKPLLLAFLATSALSFLSKQWLTRDVLHAAVGGLLFLCQLAVGYVRLSNHCHSRSLRHTMLYPPALAHPSYCTET